MTLESKNLHWNSVKKLTAMKGFLLIILLLVLSPSFAWGQNWFQNDSTWDTPATNATIDPNSDNYINDIGINSGSFYLNTGEWATPVYYATSSTPFVKVSISSSTGCGAYVSSTTGPYGQTEYYVPLDPSWLPAGNQSSLQGQYRDGQMVVITADGKYEIDLANAVNDNGNWTAGCIRWWDLSTDGIQDPYDGHGRCRQMTGPILQGLLTYDEVANGTIDHALQFTYYGEEYGPDPGTYPSQYGSYAIYGVSTRPGALSQGMRIRVKASVDCNSFGFNQYGVKICEALKTYGAIFADTSGQGSNTILVQTTDPNAGSDPAWTNLVGNFNIPSSDFELVDPVYPSSSNSNTGGSASPQPISPANGSTTGTTVTFQWKNSDSTSTNSIQLSKNGQFTDTVSVQTASAKDKSKTYAGMTGIFLFGFAITGGMRRRKKILLLLAGIVLSSMLIVSCGGGGSGSPAGGGSTASTNSGSNTPTSDGSGAQANAGNSAQTSAGSSTPAAGGSSQASAGVVTYTMSGLQANATYYWKVTATDSQGKQSESTVWSFQTQ
jgi:hypothetical protein